MPVCNAAQFLPETLRSVRAQGFTDWELIAINDHSQDESVSVLEDFATHDPRIRVFQNPGKGIVPALQKALEQAQGTCITRMDADDLMPGGRLRKMYEALQSAPAKTVVTGLVKYFAEDEVSEGYRNYEEWLNTQNRENRQWESIYRECVVASPNWFMRTVELRAAGGFDDLTYPEDYHLVFRWYQNNFQIKTVPEVTLLWREHSGRTSRTSENYNQQAFFRLKVRQFVQNENFREPLLLLGMGRKGKFTARILQELKVDFRWLTVQPQKYPQGLYGKNVLSYREIENFQSSRILVAIYPPQQEMQLLTNYLHGLKLKEGEGYWFL